MDRRVKHKIKSVVEKLHSARYSPGEIFLLLKKTIPSHVLPSRKSIYNWCGALGDADYIELNNPEQLILDEINLDTIKPVVLSKKTISIKNTTIVKPAKVVTKSSTMLISPNDLKRQIQQAFVMTLISQDTINKKYKELVDTLADEIDDAVIAHQAVLDDYNTLESRPASDYKPPLPMAEYRANLTNQLGKAIKPLTEGHKAFIDMAYDIDLKFDNTQYRQDEKKDNKTLDITVKRIDIVKDSKEYQS